ncbi:GMP reductase [Pasteurella atlantica]|uniref:GMP reductase n=2 Tax=Pasteurellaceae TaxID=712 RepID=A0ACC6HMD4_9PAST|nr:GMP reductase [Pasteurella atlantica]MDP8052017.1 GMP reductase [Pasteurella atlantica]MDP8105464.1 GMP reductase [Pasteurella atlantica]MDP8148797.1 GMP reductase [Pasteurella atlantica]
MLIEEQEYLDFDNVLIKPKRSTLNSRKDVTLTRTFTTRNSKVDIEGVPIIAANMDSVGTFEMAKSLAKFQMFTAVHKFYEVSEWQAFATENPDVLKYVFVTIGSSDKEIEKLQAIIMAIPEIRMICVDIANGYSEHFLNQIKKVRSLFPNKVLMAGNVVTYEITEELILSGVDIVKIGIGPGSVCTTRKMTGVGVPQLSATIECADAAHGLGGLVCTDGGCVNVGDISKAFGAGADFVMLGGMLSAHKESNGEVVTKDGKEFMTFYGMSSSNAMKKHYGKVNEYRASEGKAVLLPYRGEVKYTVQDILGGIRSTCTYIGASKLKYMPKRTTFIKVNRQINTVYNHFETN